MGNTQIITIFACSSDSIEKACETGEDNFGGCVRQIIIFVLSMLVSILAGYSCYRTYKSQKKLTIELLPLIINTVTSAILAYFYIQVQPFNTAIYLFIVQVYTYFILCYGLIVIVLRQTQVNSPKIQLMSKILIGITVGAVLGLVGLFLAQNVIFTSAGNQIIGCKGEQGTGTIIMIGLQIPLVVSTLYYSHKFKKILDDNYTHKSDHNHSPTFVTKHLMEAEDRYITLKKRQAKLAVMAVLVSFVFHILDIVLYQAVDGGDLCQYGNKPHICNLTQLVIRWIQNIAEMFPHFMIPFIFWYLPTQMATQYSTIYIASHYDQSSQVNSKRSKQKHEALSDLKMDHQESQFYQGLHNEDNIREKLVPQAINKLSSF